MSVVVPAAGASDDHHPVLSSLWGLGGEGERMGQTQRQAQQDDHRGEHRSLSRQCPGGGGERERERIYLLKGCAMGLVFGQT